MARSIDQRLQDLNTRRKGIDRLNRIAMDARQEVLAGSYMTEAYQSRAKNQPYTRYALGSMQEVDTDYTRISIETAQRVGKQLDQALASLGQSIQFRLQGSVPLNVHIRGVSDVDLLTLDLAFHTYAPGGAMAQQGAYTSPTSETSLGVLRKLRARCEKVLKDKYPAADVDTSGGKAIGISGGSLQRPVDVVPSHWFDCLSYQNSGAEYDRAVTIIDIKNAKTIDNWPFLHIKRVHQLDATLRGGLKKAIRLCKNVKADAEREVTLPSFDIAAVLYYADQSALGLGHIYELAILAETQRFLDYLYNNKTIAEALRTPDGSRFIFDSPGKFEGLRVLSLEMDDLALQVAKEQSILLHEQSPPSLAASRDTLRRTYVPD